MKSFDVFHYNFESHSSNMFESRNSSERYMFTEPYHPFPYTTCPCVRQVNFLREIQVRKTHKNVPMVAFLYSPSERVFFGLLCSSSQDHSKCSPTEAY